MDNTDERSGIRCNEHPDAPHGFMRDASHSAGRYVCECESWEPPKEEQKPVAYITGFYKGHCVIQPTDPALVLPVGMALYRAPVTQEPVGWMFVNEDGECEQIEYGPVFDDPGVTPLYAAPPKREWVGLTDEEMDELVNRFARYELAREIQSKLKEKNGG